MNMHSQLRKSCLGPYKKPAENPQALKLFRRNSGSAPIMPENQLIRTDRAWHRIPHIASRPKLPDRPIDQQS